MNYMKLGITVHFCSDDAMFLREMLTQTKIAGVPVSVVFFDCFFDGEPENLEIIGDLQREYPWATWVRLPMPLDRDPWHLHAVNRWAGCQALPPEITHVLFLDSDEIPEGKRLAEVPLVEALMVHGYSYWRQPTIRCNQTTPIGLLLTRRFCTKQRILENKQDRKGMRAGLRCPEFAQPIIHHFSWARPYEALLRKVQRWGHKDDKPWVHLLEEHWSQPFNGRDFLKRSSTRTYSTVPNPFPSLAWTA